jgi:glutamate N-acetyltransferase / amino-acid N-acetyltransferase
MPQSARFRKVAGGVTAAQGFSAAGVGCGIKTQVTASDLGLILSDRPCAVAGLFTTIQAPAAPVVWDRLVVQSGVAQAVVVNSGNANACTGEQGESDTAAMAIVVAEEFGLEPEQVCVASTGVIGRPLPLDKVVSGILDAAERLGPSQSDGAAFARAILTTDTREKTLAVQTVLDGKLVAIGGSCKGSGMIAPNLATMLAFITTDAAVSPAMLRRALREAADASFNCITVDGDMSTNDSVLVLANGAAGNERITKAGPAYTQFRDALAFVCTHLAKMIVRDGEGATKFVEIRVKGAASKEDAKTVARAIANSPLVKCAIHGGDPNWGRIVCRAAGCGVAFNPRTTRLEIGGVLAFDGGVPADTPAEQLAAAMQPYDIEIDLNLGLGKGSAVLWTCDLSRDYIAINADYHT